MGFSEIRLVVMKLTFETYDLMDINRAEHVTN